MSIFEKAIKRDFSSDLSYSEILELLPMLFYLKDNLEEFLASQNLSNEQLITIMGLIDLMSELKTINFQSVLTDVAKESNYKQKTGMSYLLRSATIGYICNDFDSAYSADLKLRIVLSQIIQMSMIEQKEFQLHKSELFDSEIYHNEIVMIICIVLHELPLMWSVSDVAKSLLHCQRGLQLIRSIVLNFPDQWESVCRSLVHEAAISWCCDKPNVSAGRMSITTQLNNSKYTWPYRKAVRVLLAMNPRQTSHIMEFCLSEHKLPELTLDLALDLHKAGKLSILEFLKRVLLDEGQESRQWFAGYIKRSQISGKQIQSERMRSMNARLIEVARSLLPSDPKSSLSEDSLATAQLFLKVVAALRGFTDYEFSPEMCSCLISLITSKTPVSERAIQYISFALAFFIGLRSSLISDNTDGNNSVEQRIVAWLQHLLAEQDHFYTELHNSYAQLLLLLAILFHTNQSQQIADLISGILGLKVPYMSRTIATLKKIFTHYVFKEQVITNQAARVPVTKNLNKKLRGHLPIHCVLQLLKARAFTKNKVQIKDWIYQQICNSVRPLHPLLPEMIEAYVKTIITPHEQLGTTNEHISEAEIGRALSRERVGMASLCAPAISSNQSDPDSIPVLPASSEMDLTPQLLVLYYLLIYYESSILNQPEIVRNHRQVHSYSPEIWSLIPVSYLLRYSKNHLSDYTSLYPKLLRLVTSHWPQLVLGEYIMQDELLQDDMWRLDEEADYVLDVLPSPQELKQSFDNISEDEEGILLYRLTALNSVKELESLIPYCEPLITNFPTLLLDTVYEETPTTEKIKRFPGLNYRVCVACKELWIKMHLVMPRRLEVMTINALRTKASSKSFIDSVKKKSKSWSEEEILNDPVEAILMGIDSRVFRCPPVLGTVLRVLESVLVGSRSLWEHKLRERLVFPNDERPLSTVEERNNLAKTMLMAQDVAVIQILLERCLATPSEKKSLDDISNLREVRRIICTFIHHLFISNPERCHLVHWQTYPLELIPVVVQGIPSMHICLTSVVDIFKSCADYSKMVFCINLISHLSAYYNISMAMEKANLLLEALHHIVTVVLSAEEKPSLVLPCLEALLRMAVTFPRLAGPVSQFLLTVAAECRSQLAVLHKPIPLHFTGESLGINEEDVNRFEAGLDHLSMEEKYQLCFVKCMSTYDTLVNGSLVQRLAYHSIT